MTDTDEMHAALQAVKNPHGDDVQDVNAKIESLFVAGNAVNCVLKQAVSAEWRTAIEGAIKSVTPFRQVKILVSQATPEAPRKPKVEINPDAGVAGVRHIVAIASGKGGVGKSTVTANLAVTLAKQGLKVGLLDADIYGPSMPLMLGVDDRPESPDGKVMIPIPAHGVKSLSIGYMLAKESPVVWRGPMVHSALQQMLNQAMWGELDVMLIDMPPGTGDVALTLAQHGRLAGAVVVTTPQNVALADARKAIEMFRKVDVPILGIVENMAFHVCPNCQTQTAIFGTDGGTIEARNQRVALLGKLPLQSEVCRQSDFGRPIVLESIEYAEYFDQIARNLCHHLGMDKA